MNGIRKKGVNDVLRAQQPFKLGATYFTAERHKLEMKARSEALCALTGRQK